MIFALLSLAALMAALVAIVTSIQTLYLESLRLRPRELPALSFFKDVLYSKLGLESERGVETFSLVKHLLFVVLGLLAVVIFVDGRPLSLRAVLEALAGSWATMLVFAYALPQMLYRRTSGRWLLPLTPVLRVLAATVRPLVAVFLFLQSLADLGEPEQKAEEAPTAAENIEALISAGTEEGLIEESDRELIQSVVAFGDKTIREVMSPRPSIVAIDADRSLEELRELVINEQYSRLPVYEGTIDHVIGFVHVRDMFELDEAERESRKVRELVRPVRFIPETKPMKELVKEMQQDRAHMAIVIDEYGNTAGLVTLEDLVEEVFGEIQDEHEPPLDITRDSEGAYVVSGNFGLDRLEELLDFRPDEQTESTTVGGLIMEWLGRVPQAGEAVERDGIRIEVLASNELRVEQVRVSRPENAHHA